MGYSVDYLAEARKESLKNWHDKATVSALIDIAESLRNLNESLQTLTPKPWENQ